MVIIEFLEQISERRMLLSWRESGCCNYTEQLWSLQKANCKRICAFSGKQIVEGDKIFCPMGKPLNYDRCILKDELGEIFAAGSVEASYS